MAEGVGAWGVLGHLAASRLYSTPELGGLGRGLAGALAPQSGAREPRASPGIAGSLSHFTSRVYTRCYATLPSFTAALVHLAIVR